VLLQTANCWVRWIWQRA